MSKTIVENLTGKDIRKTKKLFDNILDDTFITTFPQIAIDKYKQDWQEKNIKNAIDDKEKVMIIAKMDNEIVGLLFGSGLNGGVGNIIWIAVSSEYRGTGVGKLLCEKAEKEYQKKNAHKIVLYTETASGKKFYERIGYSHEGTHPKHWWGVDHFCMAKIL